MVNQPNQPSPWLRHPLLGMQPQTHSQASFVEYLRWMRVKSNDDTVDNGTVLELFAKFEGNDFSQALNRLTDRTKKLADEHFEVTCPWRIRVGGSKGPESMLLPAFDALGMPYIPSSTLKGVAREVASQDTNFTQKQIKEIFGDIEPNTCMGQVTFLDAHPLPGKYKQGGLLPDMANSIWRWEGTTPPQPNANPNTFLSLEKPTFIIGLRHSTGCKIETFEQVIIWLKKGLGYGIGSQVNSGYGSLDIKDEKLKRKPRILAVNFLLKGQLIHGRQTFDRWRPKNGGGWKPPGIAEAEVRSTAFRSVLRYWFRALALGVLCNQAARDLEIEIFGGIEPKPYTGLFRLEINKAKVIRDNAQNENQKYGVAEGELFLRYSSQAGTLLDDKKQALAALLQNLTWLMFHLGGVGQGARRPCYSRQNRNEVRPPYWRGSTLKARTNEDFWFIPDNLNEFKRLFRQRIKEFYLQLQQFQCAGEINYQNPRNLVTPTTDRWLEVGDKNCRIVCVTGDAINDKPFALAKLHLEYQGRRYNRVLCGSTAQPSPVWIAEVDKFQVVTVFGVNEDSRNPRNEYLQELGLRVENKIFPFNWT